jgi:hypothetical protein
MKNKLCVFFTILATLGLYACGDDKKTPNIVEKNEVEKAARTYNLPSLLGLNEEGTVVVLNSDTGEKLKPCIQQNSGQEYVKGKGGDNICQIEIKEEDGKIFVLRNGREVPDAKATKIISVAYKGSHCVAHKSGTQYEICWPW